MIYDVLIVGSGPAGLNAAIYSRRAGLSTVVIEGDTVGGLLTTTEHIENYLGFPDVTGMELALVFQEHAEKFKPVFKSGSVKTIVKNKDCSFLTVLESKETILSRSIIYAAGSTPKKLGVPGENSSGVSYCATCDGMFMSNENVLVVGGGESAVEEALYMSKLANHVTVLVRGNEWRATLPAVKKLSELSNVTVRMNTEVTKIVNDSNGNVVAVETNSGETLNVTGVFIAIGQQPNSHAADGNTVLFDDGFIKHSKTPGFFVAGDIGDPKYRQVIIAAGSGAKAAIDATEYLQ